MRNDMFLRIITATILWSIRNMVFTAWLQGPSYGECNFRNIFQAVHISFTERGRAAWGHTALVLSSMFGWCRLQPWLPHFALLFTSSSTKLLTFILYISLYRKQHHKFHASVSLNLHIAASICDNVRRKGCIDTQTLISCQIQYNYMGVWDIDL